MMRVNNGVPMTLGDPQRSSAWSLLGGTQSTDTAPSAGSNLTIGGPSPPAQSSTQLIEMQAKIDELTSQLARLTTAQIAPPMQIAAPSQGLSISPAEFMAMHASTTQHTEPLWIWMFPQSQWK